MSPTRTATPTPTPTVTATRLAVTACTSDVVAVTPLDLSSWAGVVYGDTSTGSSFFYGNPSREQIYTFTVPSTVTVSLFTVDLCDPETVMDTYIWLMKGLVSLPCVRVVVSHARSCVSTPAATVVVLVCYCRCPSSLWTTNDLVVRNQV
jgi:hypothetical protein